jgi:hypothetical protein
MFPHEVTEKLGFYVYRLIDPRNGETFYVGKGKGNRVFAHSRGERNADDDDMTDKFTLIREIRNSGFEVAHVIHRHGLDEKQAWEVEAAVIDAYPEATNQVGGRASDDRGVMHASQVIEKYKAPVAVFKHPVVLITINRSVTERDSIYDAVHYAWKIDPEKAAKAEFVLAVRQGLIMGTFKADRWLPATTDNFPGTAADRPGRWGFIGHEAPQAVAQLYFRKRLPEEMRRPGAANPVNMQDFRRSQQNAKQHAATPQAPSIESNSAEN